MDPNQQQEQRCGQARVAGVDGQGAAPERAVAGHGKEHRRQDHACQHALGKVVGSHGHDDGANHHDYDPEEGRTVSYEKVKEDLLLMKQHNIKAYRFSISLARVIPDGDGEVNEQTGVFRSSKRRENGIGIQSVTHIAEKNGGTSTFTYQNGTFSAKVMLCGC